MCVLCDILSGCWSAVGTAALFQYAAYPLRRWDLKISVRNDKTYDSPAKAASESALSIATTPSQEHPFGTLAGAGRLIPFHLAGQLAW